jgi:uncharacterized protein
MPYGRFPAWGTAGSSSTGLQVELVLQRAGDVNGGYELRRTDAKGQGVFATRAFLVGETVMVGVIDRELDHNHSHASQLSETRFVLHGGLVPSVNHSCDPNCGIHINASGAHNLVTRRPITTGQEITFDYAMRNYSIEYFAPRCRCGSLRCRGRITGWKDLPAERKAAYQGFVAPFLTDIDNRHATEPDGKSARIEPPSRSQKGRILNDVPLAGT